MASDTPVGCPRWHPVDRGDDPDRRPGPGPGRIFRTRYFRTVSRVAVAVLGRLRRHSGKRALVARTANRPLSRRSSQLSVSEPLDGVERVERSITPQP